MDTPTNIIEPINTLHNSQYIYTNESSYLIISPF